MKPSGVLLAVLGVALMLAGFGMSGAAEGERVLNIGLLNQKLIFAVAGAGAFVGGMVLVAAAEICERIGLSSPPKPSA